MDISTQIKTSGKGDTPVALKGNLQTRKYFTLSGFGSLIPLFSPHSCQPFGLLMGYEPVAVNIPIGSSSEPQKPCNIPQTQSHWDDMNLSTSVHDLSTPQSRRDDTVLRAGHDLSTRQSRRDDMILREIPQHGHKNPEGVTLFPNRDTILHLYIGTFRINPAPKGFIIQKKHHTN